MANERRYLSIGEVLGLLLEEFPDITISKIRFLESQGLIDPERTASGYRKFYDADVERLRLILREQREHYLPLKVIKDRLDSGELTGEIDLTPTGGIRLPRPRGAAWYEQGRTDRSGELPRPVTTSTPASAPASTPAAAVVAAVAPPAPRHPAPSGNGAGRSPLPPPADPSGGAARPAPTAPAAAAPAARPAEVAAPKPAPSATESPAPAPEATPEPARSRPGTIVAAAEGGATDDELCVLAGVDRDFLTDLESYGLIASRPLGRTRVYDADAVQAVVAAAGLCRRGLEPRHLRLFRTTVDKEIGLIEQLVLPLMRQRNPRAREQAAELAHDIDTLGGELRTALTRAALRRLVT